MEIKKELQEPYTEEQKINFIVEENHKNGYEIREIEREIEDTIIDPETSKETITTRKIKVLQAWGYTEEEIEQKEKERIAQLHLTRGDVFRALLLAKGVTRAQLRAIIEQLPEETNEQSITKEMALIDFDEALDFYRGVNLIDTVGTILGITTEQMDRFFETNDYKELIAQEEE